MAHRVAKDLMQTHLITVSPETPLLDAQRLFVEEEINGAPVVDDEGRLLGVVSTLDLLRASEQEHDSAASHSVYLREVLEFSSPDWSNMPDDFQDRMAQLSVSDAMTKGAVSVVPETPLGSVAKAIRANHVHRVFVVSDGLLVGLISTFDMIALLEG